MTKYYNITSNNIASPNANQSLFEIAVEQSFSNTDLVTFETYYNLPKNKITNIIGPDHPLDCIINPNDCGEANLDVQWIMAVAQNSPTTYWSVSASADDPFLEWITQIAATSNPPLVHSISYGSVESESDPASMQSFSNEVAKAGARGITVMAASGDDGVAGYIARGNKSNCGFSPSYPATVPYVTAVGATQGPEAGQPEIMCSSTTGGIITSGGGFSTVFTQPSYQATQVNNYLKNGPNMPPTNQFASNGRGFPDVALMGNRYNLNIGGRWVQECGTSASSPSFAGMVSLVNGLRISKGKSPLGFLNPLLYSINYDSFHDITQGVNNCCAAQTNPTCCQYGFTATKGWDPTTGLGTINFAQFAANLLAANNTLLH
jgi:tripeptidyl-peptidase-1